MPVDPSPPPAAPTGDVALPPPGSSARDVHAWWSALDQRERERLIAEHPARLGNLNGVPAAARDRVNRAVVEDDLARVENAAPVADALEGPERYSLSSRDVLRYRNAEQTRRGLARHQGSDPGNPRPVLLWAYDPATFIGQGRAAIAIGDPDEADHVAVVVPGAGSSVAGGWLSAGHDAAINLYDQSLIARPGEATSVISWMGYDTPDDYTDRGIAAPVLARVGGERLAEDVNGLWVTHAGLPHVTVIGHSYGATTVADAFARSGMRANDAVLLGSPGTDVARSAADFGVDSEVYVGAASTDPISWIGVSGSVPDFLNDALGQPFGPDAGLGADPAGEGFGSIRFKAEATGADVLDFGDHSHYYNLGGEALRSMVHIVTGDGAALEREGLVAQGRRQPRVTTPREVTLPWGGRIRLPRIDSRIPGTPAYIDPEAARRRAMLDGEAP
ncbi:alpha/beta hydrolase [Mycobacterium sp. IDR2000157661]|uniref:alpha/beta hydrolase n=1 Tax=Mycobacterium sp. IDR2000157661 TaxID=2867005 RepID=UPI001EEC93BF|nr:alpha/beta hydrolase [Mycobacterium sp. IDR2000157661]ULE34063.1 alpha/beta hydrolase family protein [Mycobacterium sp. IDR2000157661]